MLLRSVAITVISLPLMSGACEDNEKHRITYNAIRDLIKDLEKLPDNPDIDYIINYLNKWLEFTNWYTVHIRRCEEYLRTVISHRGNRLG